MRRRAFLRAASGLFIPAVTGLAQIPMSTGDAAFMGRKRRAASVTLSYTTGLIGWWKPETLGSNGSAIATWSDSSGSGNDLTQSVSGSRPTVATSQLNGYSAVRFAGANYFDVPNMLGGLTGAVGGEVFGVVKIDVDPPTDQFKSGLWQWGGTGERTHYPFTDGVIYDNFLAANRLTVGNPTPALTSWRLYNVTQKTPSPWAARLDGTALLTNTQTFANSGNRFVGKSRQVTTTDYFLLGYFAEILFFDHSLASGDRTTVNSYIASKFGLTIA